MFTGQAIGKSIRLIRAGTEQFQWIFKIFHTKLIVFIFWFHELYRNVSDNLR